MKFVFEKKKKEGKIFRFQLSTTNAKKEKKRYLQASLEAERLKSS